MLKEIASVTQVYLVTGYTDLRLGIDGLAALVQFERRIHWPVLKTSAVLTVAEQTFSVYFSGDIVFTPEMLEGLALSGKSTAYFFPDRRHGKVRPRRIFQPCDTPVLLEIHR